MQNNPDISSLNKLFGVIAIVKSAGSLLLGLELEITIIMLDKWITEACSKLEELQLDVHGVTESEDDEARDESGEEGLEDHQDIDVANLIRREEVEGEDWQAHSPSDS